MSKKHIFFNYKIINMKENLNLYRISIMDNDSYDMDFYVIAVNILDAERKVFEKLKLMKDKNTPKNPVVINYRLDASENSKFDSVDNLIL